MKHLVLRLIFLLSLLLLAFDCDTSSLTEPGDGDGGGETKYVYVHMNDGTVYTWDFNYVYYNSCPGWDYSQHFCWCQDGNKGDTSSSSIDKIYVLNWSQDYNCCGNKDILTYELYRKGTGPITVTTKVCLTTPKIRGKKSSEYSYTVVELSTVDWIEYQ